MREVDGLPGIALHYFMCIGPRLKNFLTAAMLPLLVIAPLFGAEGTLLCFGEDGHLAIEFVDSCNGAGGGSQLDETRSDDCGPCQDVQFISSPAHTKNAPHDMLLPLMSSSSLLLPLKEHSLRLVMTREYLHHKSLSGLYSVVLLI